VVFPILAENGGAAFVEATRKDDEAAEAHAGTARGLFGKVECEYSHNVYFFDGTLPNTSPFCKFRFGYLDQAIGKSTYA
jgi:hypothetical protein